MGAALSSTGIFATGGDGFAGVTTHAAGVSTALLNDDGTSKIHPAHGCRVEPLAGVLATEGPQRHTRAAYHRRVPRWRVTLELVQREELQAFRKAWDESRGGAGPVAWRSPDDPPGDVASAPLYRFASTEDVQRGDGGVAAEVGFVLEGV